jgi:ribosomal protein L40E
MARDSKLESGRRIVFGINYSEFPNGSTGRDSRSEQGDSRVPSPESRIPNPESRAASLSESLIDTALRELDLEVCVCGAAKPRRNSFCRKCYFSLPAGLRNRLYRTVKDGYATYYDEAKDFLKYETGRIGATG